MHRLRQTHSPAAALHARRGKHFAWTQNDIVALPNFLWRQHVNTGKSDAVLYTVSDTSLMPRVT
jgi:gentisate 1,2-dioxygenase